MGSLTRVPGNASFDQMAISGTAVVVDPGIEFQGEVVAFGSATIDAYVDISETELQFGLVRTDTTGAGFGAGSSSVLTLNVSDIDWTGNLIVAEFIESTETNSSSWGNAPEDFVVTTSPTSIQIDIAGGYILSESGELTLRYGISSVPEPVSTVPILIAIGTMLTRRKRN